MLLFSLLFRHTGSLASRFEMEGGGLAISKASLSLKFCDCTVIGKADLRRNVFLGTLLEILSAWLGLA